MFTNFRKRLASAIAPELKFTPASAEVNWQRIETLVHGPGASDYLYGSDIFNTAVLACLFAISTAYTEPPLTVYRKLKDGKIEDVPDAPLQTLLDQPTPNNELTIDEIRFWVEWAKHCDGNAYLVKTRSGNETRGNVVELWPVSPTRMEPYTEKDSGDWITYYKYQVKPGIFQKIPVENVIHIKAGLLDSDPRKGISRLKHLIRNITSDNEAEKFTATLLANYAVPGLVVWPMNGGNISPEDAEMLTAKLRQKFGGDNKGNIAVLSKESKVEQFGFNPEQMNMPGVHSHAEERISGVMGIPALLAGLGAGLQRSIQDNGRQLREFFTETKLVPEWNADGRKLTAALRADFTSDKNIYIAHDLSNVRALQEDEDAKYTRLSLAIGKPFMTRNEGRADVGLDPKPEWDTGDMTGLSGTATPGASVISTDAGVPTGGVPVSQVTLNGSQVSSLLEIINAVVSGTLPRATGVAMISLAFAVSPTDAEALMGEAGEGFVSTPAPTTTTEPPPEEDEQAAKLMLDLQRWQKRALKAHAAHDRGRLLEDFTLSVIPDYDRLMILEMLEVAKSEQDIEKIFGYRNGYKV